MKIGKEIGKFIGNIDNFKFNRKRDREIHITDEEIRECYKYEQNKNKGKAKLAKYHAYMNQEERKTHEGLTVWNYIFKTGQFKDW